MAQTRHSQATATSTTAPRDTGDDHAYGLCLLVEGFYPMMGGGETQMRLLLTALTERGVRASVVTQRRPASVSSREELGPILIHRVWPRGRNRTGKFWMMLPAAVRLFTVRRSYDVILVSGLRTLGVIGVLVSRALGRKVVLRAASCSEVSGEYAWQDMAAWKRHLVLPVLRLRNRILGRADAFLAVSEVIRQEYLEAGFPPERITRVHNGTDVDRFHPADPETRAGLRREFGLPNDRFVLVYAGKLNRGKGLPLLLRAVERLAPTHPSLLLVLVGGGANQSLSCEDELRERVASQRLEEVVRFAGYTENVAGYLQAADCFVLPSESEAMPNALIEALATGLPCIGTAVGGILDILRDGENGRTIPVGDEEALVRRIAEVMENPEEAARLGRMGREDAERRFSHEANVDQVSRVLRDVLARNRVLGSD